MARRFCAIVQGKVQAVYFRRNTQKQASKLQIQGFVTNLSNGDVKIDAQGSLQSLNKLLQWCQHGPPQARVDKIFVTWDQTTQYSDLKFNIIH
ncbi:MAG TPA: acylphosphatase [Oligoflexia bacterium]|nr:acylphosphatase [Oligoflexia bacterium]HMR23892.1 acylphosphatase [Oligoflexia bacterium]